MKNSALALFLLLLLQSVAAADQGQVLTLVSQNLNRLFDDHDDGNAEPVFSSDKYQRRIAAVAKRIVDRWQLPDIIALQEVENLHILADISTKVSQQSNVNYRPILIEGHDISGIDVGYLVRPGYRINRVQALFHNTLWRKGQSRLFSRPPLRIDVCRLACSTIVNVHLRSMRGIEKGKQARYVRNKRQRQAQTLARWIENFQQNNPRKPLIVIGDFNALTPSDRFVDVLGTILGHPDQVRPRLKSTDLIKRDLINTSAQLPVSRRVSYRYHKRKQQLDYLLVSRPLKNRIRQLVFSPIDYRFSDHASLQASIELRR